MNLNKINIDLIAIDFFDFNKPCPKQIKNCDVLRSIYSSKEKAIKNTKCNTCELNSLKIYFLKKITNLLKQ
jgi:hypothetical protein